MTIKYSKWPQNVPDEHKIYQMAIKCINIFFCKILQNLPKLGFLVWKYAIWQPCFQALSWVPRLDCLKIRDDAQSRVARWLIFKPKIPIWVNFGGSCIERCWFLYVYGHLVYFKAIRYSLRPCGVVTYLECFFPFWYVVPRKIWQPWRKFKSHWPSRPDVVKSNFEKLTKNLFTYSYWTTDAWPFSSFDYVINFDETFAWLKSW
jgi:hypothetical protein